MSPVPSQASTHPWLQALDNYRDWRLLYIFLLGCSSGFPFVLIGSNLSGWLTDTGISRSQVGLLGAVFVVYAINFLWAPLVDRVRLPIVCRLLGHRRGWIFTLQGLMLLATVGLAQTNPVDNLQLLAVFALVIASCAATHDIAIDAYRIEIIGKDSRRVPAASAMSIIGWWTGYSLPGYLAFANAESVGWAGVYSWMAVIVGLLMLFTLIVREPKTDRQALLNAAELRYAGMLNARDNDNPWSRAMVWLSVTIVEPFADFFRRNGWQLAAAILLFVFLFKIGEAFLGRMSIVFYREVGFSNEQIANYSKLVGWGLTIIFTLVGSTINIRYGIVRGLFIGGVAMAASNLMFAWIALVGPKEWLFLATIVVDNFCAAFSTVAFVSLLTWLTGRAFSGAQYALLASLGNLGRTSMSSGSGYLVDALGGNWAFFFVLTALMVIPGLVLLVFIGRKMTQGDSNR
ncbi:MFS transporter [Gilvimarinus agarilyticus]|uniref:AmpG family muropeptide MFS transporter n=1 Tax=Gilvimarinus sp. 2_MG-2023 TaxID=3062666 RepID=UPI001C09004A|nr:MFS transporter [Gilvimarinus sp. 2_MG-2023]MBU2886915.1 MFS transporter [Gilvimarinus agarilyticus]MDO6571576.1 MFS transporter [Gilvimarinus sp. 2_MG-2023]